MFLATTAIDSFWDTRKKTVFLGSWCLLPSNEPALKNLEYEVMPSLWLDREQYYLAGKYTYEIYHKLLDNLTEYLNAVHHTNHSKRFWQIILGPWLLSLIETFYDRYRSILKALDSYGEVETILLDPGSFITPHDMAHFATFSYDDFCALQQYSQVMNFLGIQCPVKGADIAMLSGRVRAKSKSLPQQTAFRLTSLLASKFSIALLDVNLPIRDLLHIALVSRFRAVPVYTHENLPCYEKIISENRSGLANLPCIDDFTRALVASLPVNFPTLYLEGFEHLRRCMPASRHNSVLVTTGGLFANERLKFYAATFAENGGLLCGMQHGGLYRSAKWMPVERHERDITDLYYTWGCNSTGSPLIRSLPNPKTNGSVKTSGPLKALYLFVTTSHPRYLYRFTSTPVSDSFQEYIRWRSSFLNALSDYNRDYVLMRMYFSDYRRNEKDALLKEFPELHFDTHQIAFENRLSESTLLIIDHPVTTMLQALASGKPTILFWNPLHWELRESAEPYFHSLRQAGILHDSSQGAAFKLNEISGDPASWWNTPDVKGARDEFCRQFAKKSTNWKKDWAEEFSKLLRPQGHRGWLGAK